MLVISICLLIHESEVHVMAACRLVVMDSNQVFFRFELGSTRCGHREDIVASSKAAGLERQHSINIDLCVLIVVQPKLRVFSLSAGICISRRNQMSLVFHFVPIAAPGVPSVPSQKPLLYLVWLIFARRPCHRAFVRRRPPTTGRAVKPTFLLFGFDTSRSSVIDQALRFENRKPDQSMVQNPHGFG